MKLPKVGDRVRVAPGTDSRIAGKVGVVHEVWTADGHRVAAAVEFPEGTRPTRWTIGVHKLTVVEAPDAGQAELAAPS